MNLNLVIELYEKEILALRAERDQAKFAGRQGAARGVAAMIPTDGNEDLVAKTFVPPQNLVSEGEQ